MKKKLLFMLLLGFLDMKVSSSQNFILYGDKTFGGNSTDDFPRIFNVGNNQLILVGASQTNIDGDKTDPLCDSSVTNNTNIWLLKIDTAYNILWDKDLGGQLSDFFPQPVMAGNNNQLIFSCTSTSDSACEKSEHRRDTLIIPKKDYWICLVDSNGNKVWDKTLGGDLDDQGPYVVRLTSGDFIVGGSSMSQISGDKTSASYSTADDYWIIKLDSLGNKLWDKVYGGTAIERSTPNQYDFSILPEADAGFLLAGGTNSPVSGNVSQAGQGGSDFWFVKIDSTGNKIWDKRYGGSLTELSGHTIHTNDNGYITIGSTVSPQGGDVSQPGLGNYDYWILKLDSLGNKQWDKRYGGNDIDLGVWIEKAPGGGYWVSGYVRSDSSNDISEPSYGFSDYWIIKIDSAGNKLWDKRFGGPGTNAGANFVIMPDSSIFLCGYADYGISAVKTDSGKGDRDYWVVHFKYTDNTTGINETTNENNLISVYPNPAKEKFTIVSSSDQGSKAKGDAFIYDVIGKEVLTRKNFLLNHYEIDIKGFNKGVYFLKVKTGENIFTRKIVKM